MRAIVAGMILSAAYGVAASGAWQGAAPAAGKKPNIAVSGCLMRQGYATLVVADAHVDATGDKAATAVASTDPPAATSIPGTPGTTPPKWVLDNAGVVAQHVGEKVQVIGASDWVANQSAPAPSEPGGPPPELPHIDVVTLKVLAPKC